MKSCLTTEGTKLSPTTLDKVKNLRFDGEQAGQGREAHAIHRHAGEGRGPVGSLTVFSFYSHGAGYRPRELTILERVEAS